MTTAPSLSDYLSFSQLAYDLTEGNLQSIPTPAGFTQSANVNVNRTGLNVVVFTNDLTKQIVIAFRGTDPNSASDLAFDTDIGLGTRPPVFDAAEAFAQSIVAENIQAGYTFCFLGRICGRFGAG